VSDQGKHCSVLLEETVSALVVSPGGTYIDGTIGGAGHAAAILERAGAESTLLGIDRDDYALGRAEERLSGIPGRVLLRRGNFDEMAELAETEQIGDVDGVLLDLGVSSFQLDMGERGFSFRVDAPLDMRMDRRQPLTAAVIVNQWPERELADAIYRYGEERASRRIAAALVKARETGEVTTTAQLAALVESVVPRRSGKHPATKTFQALRMVVNDELGALERGLMTALGLVREGGRIAVITFHSLEDRLVKRFAVAHEGRWESLMGGGQRWDGELPALRRVTRKPVAPGAVEIKGNARARSAKLRVMERVKRPAE
jgi:16S rRNA (cytosine1402-N4)-methyltransferase